jgi:hypothetical protein
MDILVLVLRSYKIMSLVTVLKVQLINVTFHFSLFSSLISWNSIIYIYFLQ